MPTISLVPNYKTRDYKYDVLPFTLNKNKIFVLLTPERGKKTQHKSTKDPTANSDVITNIVSQYLQYQISQFRDLKYLIKVTLKILDITAIQNTNISHTEYQYIFPQNYCTIILIVHNIHKEKYICILHIETFYTNKAN